MPPLISKKLADRIDNAVFAASVIGLSMLVYAAVRVAKHAGVAKEEVESAEKDAAGKKQAQIAAHKATSNAETSATSGTTVAAESDGGTMWKHKTETEKNPPQIDPPKAQRRPSRASALHQTRFRVGA